MTSTFENSTPLYLKNAIASSSVDCFIRLVLAAFLCSKQVLPSFLVYPMVIAIEPYGQVQQRGAEAPRHERL